MWRMNEDYLQSPRGAEEISPGRMEREESEVWELRESHTKNDTEEAKSEFGPDSKAMRGQWRLVRWEAQSCGVREAVRTQETVSQLRVMVKMGQGKKPTPPTNPQSSYWGNDLLLLLMVTVCSEKSHRAMASPAHRSSDRDHKDEKPWLPWQPPCRLREKGFCFGRDMHCSVCYPLAPNNVPPTKCDDCWQEEEGKREGLS